jgi:hypothetical protein
MFTVTTAVPVAQLAEGFDINVAGQIAGQGGSSGADAIFWDPATGSATTLEPGGKAFALDEAGATVAGRSAAGGPGMWVRLAGGMWSAVALEMAGSDGRVFAIVSDASGHAMRMAGSAWLGTTADTRRALMWTRTNDPWTGTSDTWRLQVNPTPGGGGAFAVGVNFRGMLVGMDGTTCCKAFYWNADGTGAVLPSLSSGAASHAWAITADGTMIVGGSNNLAVAWRRTANADGSFGDWAKPVALEPTSQFCGRNGASEAHDVAPDGSVIVGSSCGTPMAWRIASPGSTPVRTTLKGLGNPNNGWANAINANAAAPLAAGRANNTGVFWRRF